MKPRVVLRHARRLTYLIAIACTVYLWLRFDVYDLPEAGLCPVAGYASGQTLILDRSPGDFEEGEVLFARTDDGLLQLGRVTKVGDQGLWLEADAPGSPGPDSDQFGWVSPDRVEARVILAWPW